jgi:hypothetical protein
MSLGTILSINDESDHMHDDFITDSSRVIMAIQSQVRVSLNILNLIGRQSFNFDPVDLEPDDLERIQIKIRSINSLPLGGKLAIRFVDQDDVPMVDLFNGFANLLTPAKTDMQGFSIAPSIDSVYIDVSREEVRKIMGSDSFDSEIILNTSDSETGKYSKVTLNDRLKIEISLHGKLSLRL